MKYSKTVPGIFVERPNRFIAHVLINGEKNVVHVKNTGRCKELLIPDCSVILEKSSNPNRKTQFDLIAVYKKDFGLINIDSQAPNAVVKEWLLKQSYDFIKPEYSFGDSRIDFYMEKNVSGTVEKTLLEVKGCTLEKEGQGYFPDAPTERGVKHLRELSKAVSLGYKAMVAFVVQMEGVHSVLPNIETHPEFGVALEEAKKAGVQVLFLECKVFEDELFIK